MFPAGAGVIPTYSSLNGGKGRVSRRRGGDPPAPALPGQEAPCFPQARG